MVTSEAEEELFEAAQMWPIRLRLPSKRGIGIWARMDENEKLLTFRGLVTLFRNEDALRRFLATDPSHNLVRADGYERFRRFVTQGIGWSSHSFASDLVWVGRQLKSSRWDRWSPSTRLQILDSLNLLWDFGVTVEDPSITDGYEAKQAYWRAHRVADVYGCLREILATSL